MPVRKAEIPRRVVKAALELAAKQGWRDTTLADIAAEAKVSLAELHGTFRSKAAILEAFVDQIDEAVLAKEDPDLAAQPARDRVFDVMMRRFEALRPYKEGVRAIVRDTSFDPVAAACTVPSVLRSMDWMLEAAGIGTTGVSGLLRAKGLAAIYGSTLQVWLNDDTEDMSRTMAALDRRLRRAENIASVLWPGAGGRRTGEAVA